MRVGHAQMASGAGWVGTGLLWTIALVLGVLWGLGVVSAVTLGGAIHLLLAGALAAIAMRLVHVRRPLT